MMSRKYTHIHGLSVARIAACITRVQSSLMSTRKTCDVATVNSNPIQSDSDSKSDSNYEAIPIRIVVSILRARNAPGSTPT